MVHEIISSCQWALAVYIALMEKQLSQQIDVAARRLDLLLAERAARMIELKRKGYTLQEIGDLFALTRQRVMQILQRYEK